MVDANEIRQLQADLEALEQRLNSSARTAGKFDKELQDIAYNLATLRDVGGAAVNFQRMEQAARQAAAAVAELNRQMVLSATGAGVEYNPAVFRQIEENIALMQRLGSVTSFGQTFQGATPPPVTRTSSAPQEISAEAFQEFTAALTGGGGSGGASAAKESVEEFRVSLTDLQTVFRDDQAITKFQSTLGRMGFTIEDINQPIQSFSNGMRLINVEARDSEGVLRQAKLRADEFGNTLDIGNVRARTFGEVIKRNIFEVAKWSIAVGVVYGAIAKLQEALQTAIELEAELASVTIALGETQRALGTIFEESAKIAETTGQSITSVIDSYATAVRATGNITDETERFRIANDLLTDSLALATLTGMSNAESLDVMSAAIRQMGLELDEGNKLLDLWVATSQAANVDVETLAESFSIASTVAQSFGLSAQELNSIIAVMAENTSISATEVGNAVRRILSTIQSGATQDILSRFGISTQSEGELRDFLEIMERISSLYQEGVISEAQLLQIGNVAGGGSRGAAGFVGLIKNLNRVQEINVRTADNQGKAQEALAIQLDTTKTSLVELGNAFIEFAQTLGTEGGVLDAVKTLADFLSVILNLLTSVTSALGETAPALAAIGIASAVGGGRGLFSGGGGIGGIGGKLGGGALATAFGTDAMRKAGGVLGSVAAISLLTVLNAKQGEIGSAWGNAIGGAIGFYLFGPIGGLIGTSIGTAIGKSLVDYDASIGASLAARFTEAVENNPPDITDTEPTPDEALTSDIFKAQGFGVEELGKLGSQIGAFLYNVSQSIPSFPGTTKGPTGLTAEEFALGTLPEEELGEFLPRIIDNLITTGFEEGNVLSGTGFAERVGELLEKEKPAIERVLDQYREEIDFDIISGETGTDIEQRSDAIDNALAKIVQIQAAVGEEFEASSEKVTSAADAYAFFADVVIKGTPEQNQAITDLVSDIAVLETQLDQTFDPAKAQEYRQTKDELVGLLLAIQNFSQNEVTIPSIVNLGDISEEEFNQVIATAEDIAERYKIALLEQVGLSEAEIEEVVESWKPLFLRINDQFQLQEGLPQFAITDALSQITGGGTDNFDIRQLDISSTQAPQLAAAYQQVDQMISQAFPQYQDNIEEFGVIFNDNVTETLHADNLKFQLALQQLIDVNEKQLDGIYNLPTDATFWVPWTGALLAGQRGGGSSFPGTADPSSVFSQPLTDQAIANQNAPAFTLPESDRLILKNLSDSPRMEQDMETNRRIQEDLARTLGSDKLRDLPVPAEDPEVFASILKEILSSGFLTEGDREVPTFTLNLNINADFVTYLDTEAVGRAVTTYIEQQLVRSSGQSGGATLEYVV